MKIETVVSFFVGPGDDEPLRRAWSAVEPDGHLEVGHYEVRRGRGDAALAGLVEALESSGLPHEVREERVFQAREIEEAPALRVCPAAAVTAPVEEASRRDEACPLCERGRAPEGELVIEDAAPAARGFSVTREGQILVNELVARKMVEADISGGILRVVRDRAGRCREVFQILPTHTLPPALSPPTRLRIDPETRCPLCGGGGIQVTSLLYYDLAEEHFADLNLLRETEGSLAAEGIVVSQRFFRLLLASGVRGLAAEPVMLL